MFKRITVEMAEPICNCDEQSLEWGTPAAGGLYVKCKLCGTILNVSNKKFVAAFKFDRPYPGKQENPKQPAGLTVMDGGKVLEMPKPLDPPRPPPPDCGTCLKPIDTCKHKVD